MEAFEAKLAQSTASPNPEILGTSLNYRTSGHQTPADESLPVDRNSAFVLGSAGKFITHIAALQLVQKGLLTLDEPVSKYVVEFRDLKVLKKNNNEEFALKQPGKEST